MQWVVLFFAGLCEVLWAVALKYTEGFTRLYPSIVTVFGMMASFLLLSRVLRSLPLGIAYSVWTGIGTVGTVLVGVLAHARRDDESGADALCRLRCRGHRRTACTDMRVTGKIEWHCFCKKEDER